MSAIWALAGCNVASNESAETTIAANTAVEIPQGETKEAIFAGGCFWCMEPPYDALPGVLKTTSGYIGGELDNPTYEQVAAGGTGHYEAISVSYDSSRLAYEDLLEIFWQNIDPLDAGGQFCDRGQHYSSAIFVADDEQRSAAETSKQRWSDSQRFKNDTIATAILPTSQFFAAETYHQDYYLKNPVRYKFYRASCGRDRRLAELWGEEQ